MLAVTRLTVPRYGVITSQQTPRKCALMSAMTRPFSRGVRLGWCWHSSPSRSSLKRCTKTVQHSRTSRHLQVRTPPRLMLLHFLILLLSGGCLSIPHGQHRESGSEVLQRGDRGRNIKRGMAAFSRLHLSHATCPMPPVTFPPG